jgi:hypothetical protein
MYATTKQYARNSQVILFPFKLDLVTKSLPTYTPVKNGNLKGKNDSDVELSHDKTIIMKNSKVMHVVPFKEEPSR